MNKRLTQYSPYISLVSLIVLANWIIFYLIFLYITNNLGDNIIVLHYNVFEGVDLIGTSADLKKYFYITLIFSLTNAMLSAIFLRIFRLNKQKNKLNSMVSHWILFSTFIVLLTFITYILSLIRINTSFNV